MHRRASDSTARRSTGDGRTSTSATTGELRLLDGLDVDDAECEVIDVAGADGHGEGTITYKLRDWLFARQRYWGEPFPIVYDADGSPIALPEIELPVVLPEVDDFAPVTFDPDDADSRP